MSRRIDPASVVVQFFSEASPETVRTVFHICRGIVERRGLLAARKKSSKPARAATDDRRDTSSPGAAREAH